MTPVKRYELPYRYLAWSYSEKFCRSLEGSQNVTVLSGLGLTCRFPQKVFILSTKVYSTTFEVYVAARNFLRYSTANKVNYGIILMSLATEFRHSDSDAEIEIEKLVP